MKERELRRIWVQLTFLLATAGFILAACAPKSVAATAIPTEPVTIKINANGEYGAHANRTVNVGDVANEAKRLDLTDDALGCVMEIYDDPPVVPDHKEPWKSKLEANLDVLLKNVCLNALIERMASTPTK